MSTVRQTLLEHAHTACEQCFTRQLELIAEAHRLSSDVKDLNATLYLEVLRIAKLNPFPNDVPDETLTEITSTNAVVETAATPDDLEALQEKLLEQLKSIGEPADDKVSPASTDNLLNKRMIDLLYLMKDKIRTTRRRLNDAGGGYDEDAYRSVRNQLYLTQHVYLEQLDNDLVFADHEGCARIEQVLYPAILGADVSSFVSSLQDLQDFLKARVLEASVA